MVDGFVEQGKETREGVVFVPGGRVHLAGGVGLFSHFGAGFAALELCHFEFGGGVEPSGEVVSRGREFSGFEGEGEQDVLGGFLGQLAVA